MITWTKVNRNNCEFWIAGNETKRQYLRLEQVPVNKNYWSLLMGSGFPGLEHDFGFDFKADNETQAKKAAEKVLKARIKLLSQAVKLMNKFIKD